jgi:carbonic anhydrase
VAALRRLVAGNARFVARERRRGGPGLARLAQLAKSQRPFATILGCSDSRVPPELLFDRGFGDLFIVRVAGNLVSPEVLGSLQYAGAHLKTSLFVVLGHEGCGAVEAALALKFRGARTRARIEILLRSMLPGLTAVDPAPPPEVQLRAAVEANVRWSMHQFAQTPEGRRALAEGRAMLAGAVYELRTGRVRFLEP